MICPHCGRETSTPEHWQAQWERRQEREKAAQGVEAIPRNTAEADVVPEVPESDVALPDHK